MPSQPFQNLKTLAILAIVVFMVSLGGSVLAEQFPTIAAVDRVMAKFVSEHEISGAVTLVNHRGQTVHLSTVGLADEESKRAMRDDTIFWIASMTKPITATAIHILQDDGLLSIDDEVRKFIPAFADVRLRNGNPPALPITIRHLLTHTSGLDRGMIPRPPDRRTLKEQAEKMAARPLMFEPGSRWKYSGSHHVIGRIIEVVSRRSFEEFLRQRIFEPLDMRDTTFNLSAAQTKRLASLYRRDRAKEALLPAQNSFVSIEGNAAQHPSPSGGLFSTAGDVAKFYQMILNEGRLGGRIVSEKAVRAMTMIQTGNLKTGWTPGNGWGLGWCVVRKPQDVTEMLSPGSFGHGGVYGTQVWVDPKKELLYLLLIQRSDLGNSDGSDIRKAFQKAVASRYK